MKTRKYKVFICLCVLFFSFISCKTTSSTIKDEYSLYQKGAASQKRNTGNNQNNEVFSVSFDNEEVSTADNSAKNTTKKTKILKSILGFELTSSDNIKLYELIEEWYGTPYKMGGCSKAGIDCSCFAKTIYSEVYGINLSRSSIDIAKEINPAKINQLKEGDLIFFKIYKNRISHVGVYLKDNKFAHATTSKGVIVSNLDEKYWSRTFHIAGRHKNMNN